MSKWLSVAGAAGLCTWTWLRGDISGVLTTYKETAAVWSNEVLMASLWQLFQKCTYTHWNTTPYSLNIYVSVSYSYMNLKRTLSWKIEASPVRCLLNVTLQWKSRANKDGRDDASHSEQLRAQAPEVCSQSSSSIAKSRGSQDAGTPWQHPASLPGSRSGLRIIAKNTTEPLSCSVVLSSFLVFGTGKYVFFLNRISSGINLSYKRDLM